MSRVSTVVWAVDLVAVSGREGEELTNCCSVRTGSWVARPCRSRGRRSLFVRRRSRRQPQPPLCSRGAATHSQRVISCSCSSSSSSSCSCSAGPGAGASGSAASPCSLATACLPRAFWALPLRFTGALLLVVVVAALAAAAAWLAGARRRSCEMDDMSWRDSTESRTRAVGLRMRPPTMVSCFRLATAPSSPSVESEREREASAASARDEQLD